MKNKTTSFWCKLRFASMNTKGFIFGMMCFFITIILTTCKANQIWKREAVSHGKAEFYLDDNYNRQWRWLPN